MTSGAVKDVLLWYISNDSRLAVQASIAIALQCIESLEADLQRRGGGADSRLSAAFARIAELEDDRRVAIERAEVAETIVKSQAARLAADGRAAAANKRADATERRLQELQARYDAEKQLQGDWPALRLRLRNFFIRYQNQHGVSMRALARDIGVDAAMVPHWLRGTYRPKLDVEHKIAAWLIATAEEIGEPLEAQEVR